MTEEKLEKANDINAALHTIRWHLKVSCVGEYYLAPPEFLNHCQMLRIEDEVIDLLVQKEKALQKEFDEL